MLTGILIPAQQELRPPEYAPRRLQWPCNFLADDE